MTRKTQKTTRNQLRNLTYLRFGLRWSSLHRSAAPRRIYPVLVGWSSIYKNGLTGISYYTKINPLTLKLCTCSSPPLPHALATTTGGRPSGGRPRFLPVPPPPAPAPAAPPPTLAPAAFFFFGVCACGCDSAAGIGVAAPAPPDTTSDTDGVCGLRTGVAGGTTPAAAPVTIPVVVAIPATLVPMVATVAPLTPGAAVAAAASFGLDFFFEPAAAAAMAALLGRITCPSGPSFACAGFGESSGSESSTALVRRCS